MQPAGWYDDPEYPTQYRYWDGSAWTEHRAPKAPPAPTGSSSGLSDIGDWLGATFRLLVDRRLVVGAYAVMSIAASLTFGVVVMSFWDDLRYVDGSWEGFSAGRVVATVVTALVLSLVAVVLLLAVAHQVHGARFGRDVPLERSFGAAARALPRFIGWSLVLLVAYLAMMIVLVVIGSVGGGIVALAILAVIPFLVWAAVKLSFFPVACVEPVAGMNALQASAAVSRDRFWAVFGRLLLLGLIVVAISIALSAATAPFVGSLDQDDFDRLVLVENDELEFVDVGGLLEEANLVGPGVLLSILPSLGFYLVATSAVTVLFADAHGRREE